jgi:hypothetical protein
VTRALAQSEISRAIGGLPLSPEILPRIVCLVGVLRGTSIRSRSLFRAGKNIALPPLNFLNHIKKAAKSSMDRHTPLSPGSIKGEPLPTGFNELMQHNTAGSYARETMRAESIHAHSQPISRYGTPVPQSHHSQGFEASMPYQQRGGSGELVREYPISSVRAANVLFATAASLSSTGRVPARK